MDLDSTLSAIDAAHRTAAIEASQDRWWRYRCGEPNLDRYPIRCKRNLDHEPPHIGIACTGFVMWDGAGNAEPANHAGNGHYKCWGHCGRSAR